MKPPPERAPDAPYMIVSLGVTEAEHGQLLEMMGALGLPSYAGLLQTAIFELALHRCNIRTPPGLFELGRHHERRLAVRRAARRPRTDGPVGRETEIPDASGDTPPPRARATGKDATAVRRRTRGRDV